MMKMIIPISSHVLLRYLPSLLLMGTLILISRSWPSLGAVGVGDGGNMGPSNDDYWNNVDFDADVGAPYENAAEVGKDEDEENEQKKKEEEKEKEADKKVAKTVAWDERDVYEQIEWSYYVLNERNRSNVPELTQALLPRMTSHVEYNARGKVVGYKMHHYCVEDLGALRFREVAENALPDMRLTEQEEAEFTLVAAIESKHTGQIYKPQQGDRHLMALYGRRIVGYAAFSPPAPKEKCPHEWGGAYPCAYFRPLFIHAMHSYMHLRQFAEIEARLAEALILHIKRLVSEQGMGVGLLCYTHQENSQLVGKLERALEALRAAGKIGGEEALFKKGNQDASVQKHRRFVDFARKKKKKGGTK